jgi:flagellar motility protein MotE (MotC chaperone)
MNMLRSLLAPRLLQALMLTLGLMLALRVEAIVRQIDLPAAIRPPVAAVVEPNAALLAIAPAAGPEKPGAPAKPTEAPAVAGDNGGFTAAEIEILQELAQRRAAIDKRGRDMAEREALLQAAEKQIEKKLQELKQLQAAVEATLKQHGEEEDSRKQGLVKLFEGMKPPEAARIFEQMELQQLVDIIERMKQRSASPILAQLHPVRARQVAAELAKRRIPGTPGTPAPATAPAPPGNPQPQRAG